VVVVGKANTGKHTLIKQFMKMARYHNEDYGTISSVKI
jgi:GTP-binding protein EngB required for normal cell division